MRKIKIQLVNNLSQLAKTTIHNIAHSRKIEAGIVLRSKIIDLSLCGNQNQTIADDLGIHYNTVGKWQKRFCAYVNIINYISENHKDDIHDLIISVLSDEYRCGAPPVYSNEVRCSIKLIACQSPKDYGFEFSQWSLSLLRLVLIQNKIVDNISKGEIWYILDTDKIKPWKIQYYLNSKEKYDDPETFNKKVDNINEIYKKATNDEEKDLEIYCLDEMTGIQALERKYPDKPVLPGEPAKVEFEYIRHGTISLIGGFNVRTGNIFDDLFLGETRTNVDFIDAISRIYNNDTNKRYAFVCDNLNIHNSEELVRFVAKASNYTGDLGKKGKHGILKDLQSRISFLTDKSHKICFYYTPKHCSWMNQIEIWFGILNRQLLRRGSYKSVKELKESIKKFVLQYNQYFAHPFNWKYKRDEEQKVA